MQISINTLMLYICVCLYNLAKAYIWPELAPSLAKQEKHRITTQNANNYNNKNNKHQPKNSFAHHQWAKFQKAAKY